MKRLLVLVLVAGVISILAGAAAARDAARPGLRAARAWSQDEFPELSDPGLRGSYESAATDTYCIVWYNFEQYNWQGWTRQDNTAQRDTYWHVDDFADLGGGSFNRLHPIQGEKSMWCGARPNPGDPDYLCSWKKAPGYGNQWSQMLGTATGGFAFAGSITFSYTIVYDSEPDYDFTDVEYDAGGGNWQTIASYTGADTVVATHNLALTQARTKLRFHFTADGAWSDEDGLWNTDGGAIVDEITVNDSGALINYENFESYAVGATNCGIWIGTPETPFGKYSGFKNNLADKDPCGVNFGTQVVFFIGSTNPSSSYPGLFDTPFCAGPGGRVAPCQDEMIVSPVIDMTKYSTNRNSVQDGTIPPGDLPQLGGCYFRFTVYRDLGLPNLVFYLWHVRKIIGTCPGQWWDPSFVYYGGDQDYIYSAYNVGHVLAGSDPVQLAVGILDMCDVWYLIQGNCARHSPAPWFDNVRLERFKTSGPQWGYRDLDIFQDNFPELEYTLESYVRADAANDLRANDVAGIDPGDSIVVDCTSPLGGGIAEDNGGAHVGGPAVYLHVKCTYIGTDGLKPPQLAGPSFQGTYGWYDGDDGLWTIMQCDTARTAAGVVDNKYMIDLNDSLFTRGYRIDYYFTARDASGAEGALPRWSRTTPSIGMENRWYFEFTCLPTKNSDVLFVDDFTGRGSFLGSVEQYWTPVFDAVLPPNNQPDKYDVNGPSSGVSNGPGSRAKSKQLQDQYQKIIWDSGDLGSVTISDGSVNSDKSNDCRMLIDWMSFSRHRCGLWICGDDIAFDLDGLATVPALTLMNTWCGVDFVATSYFDVTGGRTGGGVVTPLMTGHADSGVFVHGGVPDKFYAYGGCFIINQFDCLEKTANGKYALSYPVYAAGNYYGGISSITPDNGLGYEVRTMWFGFSYQYVRDDAGGAPIDRFEIARDVIAWMQNTVNLDVTTTDALPKAYSLAQNFPNPFNPSTTIRYDMKDKGLATIKVYNVAGQLVRTLVNGVKDAGSYSLTWDGLNDRGSAVASGIYFYKMETKGFSETRKMVMLR